MSKRGFYLVVILLFALLGGCSEAEGESWAESLKETVFRKVLEFQLHSACPDDACKQAVTEQIQGCMVKADWHSYIAQRDNEQAQERFLLQFFPCFVDAEGKSYF